jgi:hypothetical protein
MHLRHLSWKSCFAISFLGLSGLMPAVASAADGMFTAPTDRALVYVLQGGTGSFAKLSISVNGRILENASANTSFAFVAPPGKYDISTAASGRGNLPLTVKARETYYVHIQVNAQGAPIIREVDASTGAATLSRYRALRDEPVLAKGGARTGAASSASTSAPARRAAAPSKQDASDTRNSIIVKTGRYTLSSGSQSFLSTTQDFDTTSTGVFGVEYEYRPSSGFGVSAEFSKFSNAYTVQGSSFTGDMDVIGFSVKAKKYFEVTNWFHPFVGAGIGSAATDFSGDITGSTVGVGLVGVAGAEFRTRNFGLYTELRYFSCKTSGEESGTGNTQKVDVGGMGQYIGIAFHF